MDTLKQIVLTIKTWEYILAVPALIILLTLKILLTKKMCETRYKINQQEKHHAESQHAKKQNGKKCEKCKKVINKGDTYHKYKNIKI